MNISSTQKPVVLDAGDGMKRSVPVAKNSGAQVAPAKTEVSAFAVEADAPAAREQIEKAVSTLQEFAQSVKRDLNFSVDDGSGQVVVKVTDQLPLASATTLWVAPPMVTATVAPASLVPPMVTPSSRVLTSGKVNGLPSSTDASQTNSGSMR